MAFSSGIGDRGDDMRFRNAQSPRDESTFPPVTSPLRSIGTGLSSRTTTSGDVRGQLHRRFTTNNIPTLNTPLSPIGLQRRQAAEPTEFTTATFHKLQVLEKRKLEYEYLKEQRRRFEAEMKLLDLQTKRDEEEINRLSTDIQQDKHSQPTTPPEYTDSNGFPTALSRPNRFSMSSIASQGEAGLINRASRSGSQMTSPPTSSVQGAVGSHLPSKSMPGSRRGSDDEVDAYEEADLFTPLSPASNFRSYNRMSMPATLEMRMHDGLPDLASVLGHIDTSFLFHDEDDKLLEKKNVTSPTNGKQFGTMDGFPSLMRGSDLNGNVQLSANSAALDLALSQSPGPEAQQGNGWPSFSRHRHAQQSLPNNVLRKNSQVSQVDDADMMQVNGSKAASTPAKSMAGNRRSVEFSSFSPFTGEKRSSFSSPASGPVNGMPKLQSSYSTNDIPTLKGNASAVNTHAEQHLHNHNASLGRIPANAMPNRHSRELSNGFGGALHASAAPFGPAISSGALPANGPVTPPTTSSPQAQYATANSPYYGGYGIMNLNGALGAMSIGQQPPALVNPGPGQAYNTPAMQPVYTQYQPFTSVNPYATYSPNGRLQDSQARVIQSRRLQNDSNRFMNYDLKTMPREEIYALCKDQHGCRFLQKKLEERNPEYLQIIFEETAPHVVELMTDPFGNYLCQKLLEFTDHEQRNVLVHNAAPALVTIALNQHGTRALQKMIEFVSTKEQIETIIQAFAGQVVPLIKDLNGNHVIQKCLNHLKADDAQFIFDAVGHNCIVVGTHRHGCCVLQRCIDHASGFQKNELVRQITANAIELVQDPFGNYVVQYILDLNDESFTIPLCLSFCGRIAELSKQKFSSNVIEKCIRCADMNTRRIIVEELMDHYELDKLMRDSYGNYVIQTALEFAPPDLVVHLMEQMRPILPAIRNTPYGRRIQSKVQERETRLANYEGRFSGHVSPHTVSGTQSPETSAAFIAQLPPATAPYHPGSPMYTAVGTRYGGNILSPQPHRLSNPPLPNHLQNSVQQMGYAPFGGPAQNNVGNGVATHDGTNGNGPNGMTGRLSNDGTASRRSNHSSNGVEDENGMNAQGYKGYRGPRNGNGNGNGMGGPHNGNGMGGSGYHRNRGNFF